MSGRDLPLVSVVIPTYDRPEFLLTAVSSALAQIDAHIEVIVHDNASPQDPAVMLAKLEDERIRLYRNDHNIGQTANIVAAVARARGKYVAILGDDDVWAPDFLSTLLAPMEADDAIIVSFCDHDIIDSGGRVDAAQTEIVTRRYGRHLLREGSYARFDEIALVYRSICVVSGAVVRREGIDWSSIPLDLPLSCDIYICYLLAISGGNAHFTPRRLIGYRYHSRQAMQTAHNHLADARWGLQLWLTFLRDAKVRNHGYFKTICARKAAFIILGRLSRRNWHGFAQDLSDFAKWGLLDPRVIFYYLFYLGRLWRLGIRRVVP
jgi:glycosyltransferase involved in cell wall biosynthesis